MSSETERPKQEGFELEKNIQDNLDRCLAEVGHSNESISKIVVSPVDHYHRNCYYVTFQDSDESRPTYVFKTLDAKKSWDVREDMVRREHNVGIYASKKVPGLKPRLLSGWSSATETDPALVLYSYLGEAATYIEDPEETFVILSNLLPLLVDLHTSTVSPIFGKSLDENERRQEAYLNGIGTEIARFLLNDIDRDGLDPSGKITNLIKEKWIPALDKETIFSLSHKDVTMSNIIIEGEKPISLIDWTYSRWEDPAYDLAYLAFWCVKRGKGHEIMDLINSSMEKYHQVGLYPEKTLPFFLAFKCIEYGRFKGNQWVLVGQKLLETNDMNEAILLMMREEEKNI